MKAFRTFRTALPIFLVAAVVAGCSPYYYVPATQGVPLIDERGAADLTASGHPPTQGDVSAAYGITDHVAIKADGSWYEAVRDKEEEEVVTTRRVEVGAGYFTPVMDGFVFEIYGFGGMGDVENRLIHTVDDHPETAGRMTAQFDLFGVQPNFGYKSDIWTAGFSMRFARLHYRRIKGSLIYHDVDQIQYLADRRSHFLIEPAFTFRVGIENLKFQLQYMYSINATDVFFRQKNSNFTLGLNFSL